MFSQATMLEMQARALWTPIESALACILSMDKATMLEMQARALWTPIESALACISSMVN